VTLEFYLHYSSINHPSGLNLYAAPFQKTHNVCRHDHHERRVYREDMLQRQEDDVVFAKVLLFYRQSVLVVRGKIRSPGDVEERARRLGRDCRGDAEAGACE